MKKTETSSFGTGRRESHDSSAFYGRSMYDSVFAETSTTTEISNISVPSVGDWSDKIYCQSSEKMDVIPDNSIALAFTSPPYNVGKDYDNDIDLREYLQLIENVAKEVYRVLRPGGRYVVNIANLGRKPYIPLHAFFYEVHTKIGFLPMGEIIWQKAKGANGSCAWGSWLSAKAPRLRDIHEYLLVFAKQSFSRPDKGETNISPTEFMDATLSIWNIPPESAKRVGHPAPFPVELAERVIELYSFVDDVVLDPFVGSGSTCVAAENKQRHYVGFDISTEYCELARLRIKGKGKLYMPSEKTECSELSVGFGILGIKDPLKLSDYQIQSYFENSLSQEKYSRFKKEFLNPKNAKLYEQLIGVGEKLRTSYPLFNDVKSLQWHGPLKQAESVSSAQDLVVGNTPVSIKAKSNLVFNRSPHNIFENIPQGKVLAPRSENWYLAVDPTGLQKLYNAVRNIRLDHFPESVEEFEQNANKSERNELQSEIRKLTGEEKSTFNKLYVEMCRNVASVSADTFNTHFSTSMQSSSRSTILEYIVKHLFRLDSTEYILTGLDGSKEFAVKIPDITNWKKNWAITNIEAIPDLKRRQSVVYLLVMYKNKLDKTTHSAKFHIEIRWSHGKFCGSPEAKLYKDFNWTDITFMPDIL